MQPKSIEFEDVRNLLLDPDNPRLPKDLQGGSQKEILKYIAKHEAVEDLMSAIAKNGYFEGEPVVVYRNSGDARGKWRVIEGNRRLTSVKLLLDPGLYPARPSLAEIAAEAPRKNKPERLPVVRVNSREEALPYLGSRHIVGVKAWEPLPKARYMLQLFELTSKKKAPQLRYREVAKQIGSGKRTDYIKKNLDALAVFNVIQAADFYKDASTNELNFSFGVLYTALDWKPIAGYVGVVEYDPDRDLILEDRHPIVNPRVLKKAEIADLYAWCFRRSSETGSTVLGESRNLPKLAEILRSPQATAALKRSGSLAVAYEKSEGTVTELNHALTRALQELRYSNSIVANASYDTVTDDLATSVLEQAKAVKSATVSKAQGARE